MANSGIVWVDAVFDWCVRLLYEMAALIGMTYEEINVYIFVIIDDRISIFKHRRRCTLSLRTVPGRAREMMIRIAST